jgi:hypothetical protein
VWLVVNARTEAEETRIRWDIIDIDASGNATAGGMALAKADGGSAHGPQDLALFN